MLELRLYARADPAKGKFRAFLLASLKNFLADEWDRRRRLKRGGDLRFVLLDEELAAVEASCSRERVDLPLNEERLFEQRWAATLTAGAMKRLKEKYVAGTKARVFEALKPYLSGGETANPSSELGFSVEVPVNRALAVTTSVTASQPFLPPNRPQTSALAGPNYPAEESACGELQLHHLDCFLPRILPRWASM